MSCYVGPFLSGFFHLFTQIQFRTRHRAFHFAQSSFAIRFRACLHGGGGPQIGGVTCGGSPQLSCKRDQSARQIAQNRKLSQHFPTKNTSQYPWWGEEIRDSPGLKDLALPWRIGVPFLDAREICELRLHRVTCLASHYVGKQHQTNNEPQNRIKWPWIELRLRKSNNKPKFT